MSHLPQFSPITVHDYVMLPDGGPRYQLVEGELFMAPAPNRYHQQISRNLEFILLKYLENNPIGELYDAPFDAYLTEINVFQPDICFIAEKNFSILSDRGIEGAPDFVVEILSPSTSHLDLGPKTKIYACTGVQELWIIDPEAQKIKVFYLKESTSNPQQTVGLEDTLASPIFPDLAIAVSKIFFRRA